MPMIVDWVELIHELIAFGMTLSIRFDTQRALIPQCSPPGQRGKGTTLCWRGNWQQPLVGNGSSCSPLICGWAVTLEDAFLGKLLEHNSENIYEISSGSTTGIMRMAWQIKTPNKKCILPTVREKTIPVPGELVGVLQLLARIMGRFLFLVLCHQVAAAWAERRSCPYYQVGRRGDRVGDPSSGSVQFSEPT